MAGGRSAGWVREPAVAGLFYPAAPAELKTSVDAHVAAAPLPTAGEPKAIIAPHAGYRYSGATAGAAYRAVADRRGRVTRVVVLGPAHRVPVSGVGIGVTTAGAWRTPLGDVFVDVATCRSLVEDGQAVEADEAHAPEHSLEVHLPFLQRVLGPVAVVPLVVGRCAARSVADLLDRLWGGEETLVVVSSDLSHYLDDASARRRDRRTRHAILEGRAGDIGPYDACGCVPVAGLILAAVHHDVAPRTLAVATSADAAGDARRVVGYGAFGFDPPRPLVAGERRWLLARARAAIAADLAPGGADRPDDEDVPERLRLPGASFVTLELDGRLTGCIGSLESRRPLWKDVARNARAAAFADPRFDPMAAGDLSRTEITVSVLSGLDPLPAGHDELVQALRPGVDGVLLESGDHRGTFLPAVWAKLPDAVDFVDHLVGKAGLAEGTWPVDAKAWRYTTDEFADSATARAQA